MILRYNIYKYCLLGLCLAGLMQSGCKKTLDIDPPIASITAQKAFSTDALANSAMAGIYSAMMSNNGVQNFSNGVSMLYSAMSADELLNVKGSASTTDYPFESNTLTINNGISDAGIWKPAYNIIFNCNLAIEQLAITTSADVSQKTKVQLTAECKFVRAFCFFYLVNFFGDVPLTMTSDYNINRHLLRSPQADVYRQIIQDLKDAQNDLAGDYSVSGGERIRANKWAATALLARVYLYQKDWQNAIAQSTAVINSSQFTLVPDLNSVFLKNSTEAILQLQQNITVIPNNSTWDAVAVLPLFNWDDYAAALGDDAPLFLQIPSLYESIAENVTPKYYLTPQLASAFESGDSRLKNWVRATPTPDADPYTGITYYYPYKYTTSIPSQSKAPTQYYMILRLAEQYLIRAEAEAQTSNVAAAAADINIIRKRAGLSNTKAANPSDLLVAVAHERQIELFCEFGHRFFDLKRTGKAASVLGLLPEKKSFNVNQLLYPIPGNEITVDPLLKQNPGYSF